MQLGAFLLFDVRVSFRVNVSCNYNGVAKRTSNKARAITYFPTSGFIGVVVAMTGEPGLVGKLVKI